MRIGIDLFPLVPGSGRGGGFQRYAERLLAAMQDLPPKHQYYLFVNRHNSALFPESDNFKHVRIPLPPHRWVWPFRLAWLHLLLPALAWRYRLELVHFPFDTAPIFLRSPFVVTILDLITDVYYPSHYPGSVNPLKAYYLRQVKRRSGHRAQVVICLSQATALELERHYGIPANKISVIPLAADGFIDAHRIHSNPPYILSIVSLSPHKNITGVIQAFARARAQYGLPHELRLIGMRGTDARRIERTINAGVTHGLPLRYLGYVGEDELVKNYAGADLLVFLSYVEGFGLPPLEAMAAGVPVIASNASSLREVCGDAAVLVDPDDVEAAAASIGRVLQDPEFAAKLTAAGLKRARAFSWTQCAAMTVLAYERAAAHVGKRGRA
jgi:glycosyltransferase involved in cell wall biosynthesis